MKLTILSVLLLVAISECYGSEHCTTSPLPKTDVDFSLYTYRNKTGHIISQIQLEHEDLSGKYFPKNTGKWKVDLNQETVKCDGVQTVQIVATISGPQLQSSKPIAGPPPAPGYNLHHKTGSYYKLHKTGKSWDEGRRICQEEGAHLAVVNSEKEAEVLVTFFAESSSLVNVQHKDQLSIGFHDRFINGEYLTITGTTLAKAGFSRWASPALPDNSAGKEHCGSLTTNGGLNDIPCDTLKLAFICELEAY